MYSYVHVLNYVHPTKKIKKGKQKKIYGKEDW